MKLFICALIVLALIASFCIFGAATCTSIIDEMLDLLDAAAPQADGVIPPQAETASQALLKNWQQHFFCISMFLPHHHLDDVKAAMITLCSYAQTDEYADWLHAHARTREALLHLRGLLRADADNIL